ncbi:hypothetical protein [Mesorhizobium sp. M0130]|uniref:hypothetical protein n=1 Tax=Mesorhizobium sp. M0130 TaxID=2956887 RepID=UPI00333A8555
MLNISPVEILYPVVLHLCGEDQAEAETPMAIVEKLANFDGLTASSHSELSSSPEDEGD